MGGGRWHPSYCRHCGRTVEDTGYISARGRCPECWSQRDHQNQADLHNHRGPWFEHWRRRCLAALGVVDDG